MTGEEDFEEEDVGIVDAEDIEMVGLTSGFGDDDDDEDSGSSDDDEEDGFDDEPDAKELRARASRLLGGFNDDDDEPDGGGDRRRWGKRPAARRVSSDILEEHLLWGAWNRWEEPCLLSVGVTLLGVVPLLIGWTVFVLGFAGRLWAVWVFVVHLQFRLGAAAWYVKSTTVVGFSQRRLLRGVCSAVTLLEVVLCGLVYPAVAGVARDAFYQDLDGTWISDWESEARVLWLLRAWGGVVVLLRVIIGGGALGVRILKADSSDSSYREWRPTFMERESLPGGPDSHKHLHNVLRVGHYATTVLHILCVLSAVSHFAPFWPATGFVPEDCDALDDTECALPFPSFHHLQKDPSTETGWRVRPRGLPPLRGGIPFASGFVQELDGFSTSAPILFYMEGLKKAHEHRTDNRVELRGPEEIAASTTGDSITLLLDVDASELVPHSAEIDYLDPDKPLVMVIPAAPLKHATHYAVLVRGAADKHGKPLPRTPGMEAVLKSSDSDRRNRYMQTVFPAYREAAPWTTTDVRNAADELAEIQLLFDFVTASAGSQLGNSRKVRDATMARLGGTRWGWEDHARIVREEHHSCDDDPTARIARTLHFESDVPWFLGTTNSRYALLDPVVDPATNTNTGTAKALVRVPCSLERAALGQPGGKPLRAVMEFGHGLFGNRGEVMEDYLSKMADENGWVLFALDWRGMSVYDLPVAIKVFIGTPNLFGAIRDNLIQGFANKLAFQHFSQNGLLERLRFGGNPIPTHNDERPASVYYGISQGAILGGGYMAWAGTTGLVDRGVLGVPGSPFALVMTRSLDFLGYDKLLLLNFYNNRHVRMLLSLAQMGWDSVEVSGLLGRPVREPLPRMLLQAGLGDAVVPTSAAESMARAMNAVTLPHNPREIYGVPTAQAANETWNGPDISLTELMYEKEYSSLPLDDVPAPANSVHFCVRHDEALIHQIEEFVNNDRVIDPCLEDQCRRISSQC